MSVALVYSSAFSEREYLSASKLIDAIFTTKKKRRIIVERNRFTYVPADGTRKMVIRLKRFSWFLRREPLKYMAFFLYLYILIQYTMSTIFAITLISVIIWISYEIWRAPTYDDNMNLIQPEKKLKDLFKKKLWTYKYGKAQN